MFLTNAKVSAKDEDSIKLDTTLKRKEDNSLRALKVTFTSQGNKLRRKD